MAKRSDEYATAAVSDLNSGLGMIYRAMVELHRMSGNGSMRTSGYGRRASIGGTMYDKLLIEAMDSPYEAEIHYFGSDPGYFLGRACDVDLGEWVVLSDDEDLNGCYPARDAEGLGYALIQCGKAKWVRIETPKKVTVFDERQL